MRFLTVLLTLALLSLPTHADSTRLLKYSGGEITQPYWFKDSFLDLADDLEEATEEDKVLMLYFHQAGCPYCFNMIQQNFLDARLAPFIQEKFDVIALDLWGDREVSLPDGTVLSEKALAAKWKIQYTPTLVFLNGDGSISLRIDGFRPKPVFSKILDYALNPQTDYSLAQSLVQGSQEKSLYPQPFLLDTRDLSTLKGKPLAVMFEYRGCEDCEALHRNAFARPAVHDLIKQYSVVRFDATSSEPIVLPDGSVTTPAKWAESTNLSYFPSTLLFDQQGIERMQIGGYVQAFHYATALDYVLEKGYEKFPEFQRYLNDRADRLRERGTKVVITE